MNKWLLILSLAMSFPSYAVVFGQEESPEHADEILSTANYYNKALSVFINDYPYTEKPILEKIRPLLQKRNNQASTAEIEAYAITYLSAQPGGSSDKADICASYPTLVPGFRHVIPLFLCVAPTTNTVRDFIKSHPEFKEKALEAILKHRNLSVDEKNKLLLLEQRVKYFGMEPPSNILSMTECAEFELQVKSDTPKKTFYICVD